MDRYYLNKKGESWQFKKEGAKRATLRSETKADAIKQMQEFMSDKIGSVRIQKENGQFQEERTYQRRDDPRETRG